MEQKQLSHTRRRPTPFQKNRRAQALLLRLLLVGTVALFVLVGFLKKDQAFSQNENRKLAQIPKFSFSRLTDGSYLKDLGSYTADQFPGRDSWISLNLRMNRFLGQKESMGVYLCRDNYLMQIPSEPNVTQVQRNISAINAFAQTYPDLNMVMTIAPNAVTICKDKLPKNAPVRDQLADLDNLKNQLNGVTFLDVTDTLMAHKNEYLYYRTDHHWTSHAAHYAFQAIAPSLNITLPETEDYTIYKVSNTFEGTLSSKSGSHSARDTVEIYVPKTDIDYYVTYDDTDQTICSMYDRTALGKKDHYTVFFGGNHSRVDITTTADTGRNLLLFKDSYANCMAQFLYPYFDHITIIDPRYYYDNVDLIIKTEGITDVLFLYNLDTFHGDTSLADVLLDGSSLGNTQPEQNV